MSEKLYYRFAWFLEKYFGGHINIGPVTIYGWNAMHIAVNIHTQRWGYICFHPTFYMFGNWWPWYFYVSPNATPWASTFAVGPGVDRSDKVMSAIRRYLFGHNFNAEGDFSQWNRGYTDELAHIRFLNRLSPEDRASLFAEGEA